MVRMSLLGYRIYKQIKRCSINRARPIHSFSFFTPDEGTALAPPLKMFAPCTPNTRDDDHDDDKIDARKQQSAQPSLLFLRSPSAHLPLARDSRSSAPATSASALTKKQNKRPIKVNIDSLILHQKHTILLPRNAIQPPCSLFRSLS